MSNLENKGKVEDFNESDLQREKPYGNIGPDRSREEVRIVAKLGKKRAKGSTAESGRKANLGAVSTAIGAFINR